MYYVSTESFPKKQYFEISITFKFIQSQKCKN